MVTRCHVGRLEPGSHDRAEVAEVLVTGRTARTAATRRNEPEHDVVALLEPADARPDLGDDAGTLVATDHRQLERQIAGDQVFIGVTHA